MGGHKKTFFNLCLCEIGNLAMVLINFHLVDKFLGGTFKNYGVQLFHHLSSPSSHNPMCFAFPTMVGHIDLYLILPLENYQAVLWFIFLSLKRNTLDCLLVTPAVLIGQVFEAFLSLRQRHLTKCSVPKKLVPNE